MNDDVGIMLLEFSAYIGWLELQEILYKNEKNLTSFVKWTGILTLVIYL